MYWVFNVEFDAGVGVAISATGLHIFLNFLGVSVVSRQQRRQLLRARSRSHSQEHLGSGGL
jgi:hypothetical protein